MTVAALFDSAYENLTATYMALGSGLRGTTQHRSARYQGCSSIIEHALCNFAVGRGLTLVDGMECRELAMENRAFCVYVPVGDRQSAESLSGNGFDSSMRIEILAGVAEDLPETTVKMDSADRTHFSRFVSSQFYGRHQMRHRELMVEALLTAKTLEPFAVSASGQTRAALNLVRSEGVWGLYNLCVASAFRNRGLGTNCVRWAWLQAAEHGEIVTLQSDSRLSGWYRSLGFAPLGAVEAFRLRPPGSRLL